MMDQKVRLNDQEDLLTVLPTRDDGESGESRVDAKMMEMIGGQETEGRKQRHRNVAPSMALNPQTSSPTIPTSDTPKRSRVKKIQISEKELENKNVGHRQRLYQRFDSSNGEGMLDEDLIELLIAYAVPRRDVKLIARRLLQKYGSISLVLKAKALSLQAVPEVGPSIARLIRLVDALNHRAVTRQLANSNVMADHQSIVESIYHILDNQRREALLMMMLNTKGVLLKTEIVAEGTIDHVNVYTREIVQKALEQGAAAILIAHNHPSGDLTASHEDIKMTHQIVKAVEMVGIHFIDHYVVANRQYISMRALGLIV